MAEDRRFAKVLRGCMRSRNRARHRRRHTRRSASHKPVRISSQWRRLEIREPVREPWRSRDMGLRDQKIPGGSHREWHGECGAVTMNDVEAKEDGNVQTR